MKNKLSLLFALLILSVSLKAAPSVAYIIPDIGTPGLATYLEIISAHDGIGNFGADRKIDNPYTDPSLKIEFSNPSDANKVSFAPLVVSWGGRMIATQVFVNPALPMPNSEDVAQLTNANKVLFRVVANGVNSEWQTFYLVKPYQFPDLSSNTSDYVFGEGNLGKRSPRGCMIVDNLKLNNAVQYKVSTNDCDPNTDGNQGYLPFVLIAKNDIIGKNDGGNITTINLSGNAKDGGPGGGGGGGKFCDANLAGYANGDGEDGGKGFVAGGPGGGNKSGLFFVPDKFKNWGEGSGSNNGSLNGVVRPERKNYENSGGGTGHPFGFSGRAAWVGSPSEGNNAGGYGGGSGGDQNSPGGGAGYSTVGAGTNLYNSGRIHGNNIVVPIAGGSGGASGNPQGLGNCSGNGGGGGGAIRIFAKRLKDVKIIANGADATNGVDNTYGGGGSGGHIGLFSKLNAEGIKLSAIGGKSGENASSPINGAGRIRIDAFQEAIAEIEPNTNITPQASYRGFASDTTHLVYKKCKINGKKEQSDALDLYLKGESEANWRLIKTETSYSNTWSVNLDLTTGDTLFYFFAMKPMSPSGKVDDYQYLPTYDYSQAAYNILLLDKFPEIASDTTLEIKEKECPGSHPTGKFTVTNIGNADLVLNMDNAHFKSGTSIFSVSPKSVLTVKPRKSVEISVTLNTDKIGVVIDTLYFPHNDEHSYHYPEWRVAIKAEIAQYSAQFKKLEDSNIDLDTLDFGVFCEGAAATENKAVAIKKYTEFPTNVSKLILKDNENIFGVDPANVAFVPPLDTLQARFSFKGASAGTHISAVYVYLKDCDTPKDTLYLKAVVEKPTIIANDLDLGKTCRKSPLSSNIRIQNPTNLTYNFSDIKVVGISGITAELQDNDPKFLPKSQKELIVKYLPNSLPVGVHSGKIQFNNASCKDLPEINLKIEIVETKLEALPETIDFDLVEVGQSKEIKAKIKVKQGAASIKAFINPGLPFRVVSTSPQLPAILNNGNEIEYTVSFSPTSVGTFQDSIIIGTELNGNMCEDTVIVYLKARANAGLAIVSRNFIDFGINANCHDVQDTVFIKNIGQFDIKVDRAEITGSGKDYYSIINPNANDAYVLKPNELKVYTIRYNATLPPISKQEAILNFINDKATLPKVKLSGESEEMLLVASPASPINIGSVPINEKRSIDISFTNQGNIPIIINSISSANAILDMNSLVINPKETKIVKAEVQVTSVGNNSYTINYKTSSPCQEDRQFQINAIGLEGKVEVTPSYDFGVLAPCEVGSSHITLKNTGDTDISLESIEIRGADKAYFSITNMPNLPSNLAPTTGVVINANFNPTAASDGLKTAEIAFKVKIDGKQAELITRLQGTKQAGLLKTPDLLDYGKVKLNTSKTLNLKLKNTGVHTISELSLVLLSAGNTFSMLPEISNKILQTNEELSINVSFQPKAIKSYSDTIKVYYKINTCSDSMQVALRGDGTTAMKLALRLPKFADKDPRASILDIPIYAKLIAGDADAKLENTNIQFDIYLNATLYTADGISNGTLSNEINKQTQERILKVNINQKQLTSAETEVARIKGYPLLGNDTKTKLEIMNAVAINAGDTLEITPENGELSYIICREGGDRLINYNTPLSMKINPNPAMDKANINITALENGKHSLEVVNLIGGILLQNSFVVSDDKRNFNYEINLSDYPSGIYIIIIKAPNQITTQQLRIIK